MTILALRAVEPRDGLARWRRQLGLSQAQLSELSGVGLRTLQRLEAEPRPPLTRSLIAAMTVLVATEWFRFESSNGRAS
jgi:transcriptional regulator with XRE-family HTH domain